VRGESGTTDLMTRAEVAAYFRVAPSTVSRWVTDGALTPFRLNGVIRFKREDIERLLAGENAG
jgi:excisionase family DNA binding protein